MNGIVKLANVTHLKSLLLPHVHLKTPFGTLVLINIQNNTISQNEMELAWNVNNVFCVVLFNITTKPNYIIPFSTTHLHPKQNYYIQTIKPALMTLMDDDNGKSQIAFSHSRDGALVMLLTIVNDCNNSGSNYCGTDPHLTIFHCHYNGGILPKGMRELESSKYSERLILPYPTNIQEIRNDFAYATTDFNIYLTQDKKSDYAKKYGINNFTFQTKALPQSSKEWLKELQMCRKHYKRYKKLKKQGRLEIDHRLFI